jgi:tetratricopeptide (TPR) repeat protein
LGAPLGLTLILTPEVRSSLNRLVSFLLAWMVLGLAASTASSDDKGLCANRNTPVDPAIAACTKMISAGRFKGPALSTVYDWRGSHLNRKGDFDHAFQDFSEAIRLNPRNATAFHNRGFAYQRKTDPDNAIADFSEAIRLNQNFALAYRNRGDAWRQKSDFDRAIADYGEAIRLNPKDSYSHNLRGNVWFAKRDFDRAMPDYDEAIRLNPKDAVFYTNRANTWRQKSDLDRAMADYNQAIRVNPKYVIAYTNRAAAWRKKNELDHAMADYDQALRINSSDPNLYVIRGLFYEARGDRNHAQADFKAAIAIPAKFEAGRKAQEKARARLTILTGVTDPGQPAAPGSSAANGRLALVIGNGRYANALELPNPPNDARAVAKSLREIGFGVIEGTDLDRTAMERAIRDFLHQAPTARVSLLFYAGHGMQINGKNYLVPVDAKLSAPGDVEFETVELDKILSGLDDESRANIVILDACRDNPLAKSLVAKSRSVAIPGGLAAFSSVGTGTLIAYSTAPDHTALDGEGVNSPFTSSLIKHMSTPGIEVNQMLTRVRIDVATLTKAKQVPWVNSSLLGEVFLAGTPKF